jgi:hypothetical protein
MSEAYWLRTHPVAGGPPARAAAARTAQNRGHEAGEPKLVAHATALQKQAISTTTGPRHNPEAARQLFEKKDRDNTGYLEIPQLLSVAEELWRTSHPRDPLLSSDSIDVGFQNRGPLVSFG